MHSGAMAPRFRLGHRPGLDGLRGVAILLVLACHLTQWWWPSPLGSIGVTLFFTLSGFLITALLLEEGSRGRVSLRAFYERRARRLFPALAVMVAFAGSAMVVLDIAPPTMIAWVVVYAGNWYSTANGVTGLLGHTWSLAIEEQFYIAWPIVLLGARRWRHGPLTVAGAGIVAALVLRVVLWDGGAGLSRVSFGTDTRADSLLVGCGLAVLLHSGVRVVVPPRLAISVSAVAVVVLLAWRTPWAGVVLAETVVPWVAALLIVHALTGPRWLCDPTLAWFGQRSYGIYLWNWPIVALLAFKVDLTPQLIVVATLATLGMAELSWWYVERPILRGRSVVAASAPGAELVGLRGRPDPA